MKKFIFVLLFLLGATVLKSQVTYFNNRYCNDNWGMAWSVLERDQGYMVCGISGEESQGYVFYRVVVTALDAAGNQVSWNTYGEDFHNYYCGNTRGCIKTADGGYAISGAILDTIRVVGMLLKLDENGDSLWTRIYGDTVTPGYTGCGFNTCTQLPDKGYLLLGDRFVSGDDLDVLLIRTDSLGNQVWERTYGALHHIESGYSIAQLPTGEFLIGLMEQDINFNYSADPGLLKVDSEGNLLWLRYYGSTMDDWGCAVALSQDGNYLMGSAFCTSEPGPGWPLLQPWIFKTDTSGNILWQQKFEGPRFTGNACTIDELDDGTIITSGQGGFEDCGATQGYILKTEPDGDSLWMRRYNHYPLEYGFLNHLYDLHLTSDHGMILAGETLGDPERKQFLWVQKLDSIGCDSVKCDTTVGIVQLKPEEHAPQDFNIYPNPASDRIYISFNDHSPAWLPDKQIGIFNVFGEEVARIKIPADTELYDYNVQHLPPGLYLLVIKQRQRVIFTGKFLIAR